MTSHHHPGIARSDIQRRISSGTVIKQDGDFKETVATPTGQELMDQVWYSTPDQ